MLYAASVWLTPITRRGDGMRKSRGSVGAATKLARVQRMAAIHITGALRTTANDTLDAHADLLPLDLLIDKHCFREALRLATLPTTHPLQSHVKKAAKRKPKKFPSPLHVLFHAYPIDPPSVETIEAVRRSPKWKSKLRTHIATKQEKAVEEECNNRSDIRIYADGSGIEGNIGAAAVLYRNGRLRRSLKCQLGTILHHTVHEGELVGVGLGFDLLWKEAAYHSVAFFVDNQAAIQRTNSRKPNAGHYLVDYIHRQAARILQQYPDLPIVINWVPGHQGVQGNEVADELAKEAARDGSSPDNQLPKLFRSRHPLPHSKSALKQTHNAVLKTVASTMFESSPRCAAQRRIDPLIPSSKFQTLIQGLPRRHASLLMQLRSGHAPLNKHLHRIGCVESPLCPACEEAQETVLHLLLVCPAYERHRQVLRYSLKRDSMDLHNLLSKRTSIKPLFKFLASM